MVEPQNSHAVMPANSAGERRSTLRRRGLWLLPLLVPGILGGIAVPAQAATTSTTAVSHTTVAKPVVSRAVLRARAVNARNKAIVHYAERFTGVPYRYGGTSRHGFDCSGFTQHVYARFHIRLPHSSAKQGRMGHRVAKKHARAGDLLVFSGGSHVGIYVGHHRFIDAPMPGRRVHVHSIYTHDYYVVRLRA